MKQLNILKYMYTNSNTILYKKYKKLFKIMQKLGANMYFFYIPEIPMN